MIIISIHLKEHSNDNMFIMKQQEERRKAAEAQAQGQAEPDEN